MSANPLKECSLFVVRYVPNIVRNEGLNIGVLLYCPAERYLGCLFAGDLRRIRRFDSCADLALLGELQEDFEKQIDDHETDLEDYLRDLTGSLSNMIQLEGPRGCLLKDPPAEIQEIYSRYVGIGRAKAAGEDTRLRIKQRLAGAFVRAGVWDRLEKKIPASRWTQPGDPFTFDYGYQPNGALKLIHALSLERDTQLAKTLAYTLDCIRRVDSAYLTAVVGGLPKAEDQVAEATQSILKESGISVLPLSEINVLAATVRTELRVSHGTL